MKYIFVIGVVLCALVLSRPAEAQIYSWRDANGTLTVSDRPRNATGGAVMVRVGAPTSPLSSRANPFYESLIRQHASRQGIRPDLVRAVIQVESAFNPQAVSPKGAMGLMQLMPATAKELGVVDPFNPAENIRAGVTYLRQLLDKYNDNEQLALAAYNAGPGAVDRHGSKVPPYRETQKYVKKIADIRGASAGATRSRIYRVTEVVDGRSIVRYTNTKPDSGSYEEVRR